jgi:signal transduction histidine kinase
VILRSATSRLIVAHLALVALSTALVLAFVHFSTTRLIEAEVRQVVGAEIRGLADDYGSTGVAGLALAIKRRLSSADSRDSVYLLADSQGHRIAGNLGAWPPDVRPGAGWVELELYRTDRDRPSMVSAASLLLAGGERVLVGRDAQARVTFDRTLVKALFWALGVSAALALASGWLLSRFVDSRVRDIAGTAEEIMHGALARRVPVRGGNDEFDRLAATLNRMLDRIEVLVGDMRMVTDGVAHDLRSPLTRLRAGLDHSLDDSLSAEERREHIERALAEADGVLRSFAALLEIARAEAGVGRDQFEPVDLGRLAADMIDLYGPSAEQKHIALTSTGGGATVSGHPQLLANAVANLVENAICHAPEGGKVELTVASGPEGPALTVADDGPGVPEAERGRVVERFIRLDDSRGRPGAGLGLSLVAAVARMHDAELSLADNAPGLRATLHFMRDRRRNAAK